MPSGKRKRTVYLPRRRRKRRKTKLADKKINTLVEKRMVTIARKEAKKSRASTYKDVSLGSYTANGSISTYATQVPTDAPLLGAVDLNILPRYDEDVHGADLVGKRIGDDVWLKGWKIRGMLHVAGSNDMVEQRLCMALISARRPVTADHTGPALLNDYPGTLMFNQLNGEVKDEAQRETFSHVKVEKLKVFKLKSISKNSINRPFSFDFWFKKPKRIQYSPSDPNGLYPINRSYFLTMYTDQDHSTGVNGVRFICSIRSFFYTE